MAAIDAVYTAHPFYGSRRIKGGLVDDYGITAARKKVQRLMRLMGIEGIAPGPATSIPAPGHRTYPYLLKNLPITRPNQVWGTDITYTPLPKGFCYLTAIIDWFSRYVVAWELSATLDAAFCIRTLVSAFRRAVPDIHNSDQGSQFTAHAYTDILDAHGVAISMDGRGRCLDNIFTERLWRTVKYEDIYLKSYRSLDEVHAGLADYFPFYNAKRRHQALGNRTPAQVYAGAT